MFEFLEFCEQTGIKAVVTLNNDESPSDMADLVEYAYGDSEKTALGRARAAEMPSHPHPYAPFITEIGNEQALSSTLLSDTVAIAKAMLKRRSDLELKVPLDFAVGGMYNAYNITQWQPFQQALDALPTTNSSWFIGAKDTLLSFFLFARNLSTVFVIFQAIPWTIMSTAYYEH